MRKNKKIIITILICIVITIFNIDSFAIDTINYEENINIIRNPDRGFYKLLQIELNEDQDFTDFEEDIKDIEENDSDVSIISFQINLKNLVQNNDKISKKQIQNINKYFEIMRNYGYKVIFRAVYDKEGEENPEPEFNTIISHIDQLKEVYEKNKDIIYLVEAGFLGSYGEWHSGKYEDDKNKRNQIIEKLLEAVPEPIQINLRRPIFINDYIGTNDIITETTAFSSDKISRIGLHNDGYLGSETDRGTFKSSERESSINWQEKQTKYTIFGGEAQKADSIYTNLENAINDMKKRHCSYLNKTYDKEVKGKWKNTAYNGEDKKYIGKNGYEYIQNHLGYRLVLRKSDILEKMENIQDINIQIENVGFGNIINPKTVEIIYHNEQNDYIYELPVDIRKLSTQEKYINIQIDEQLPKELPNGKYEIYIRIREPYDTLKNNTKYMTKFANENIWNETLGANYIGESQVINNNYSNIDTKENEINKIPLISKIVFCGLIVLVTIIIIYIIESKSKKQGGK